MSNNEYEKFYSNKVCARIIDIDFSIALQNHGCERLFHMAFNAYKFNKINWKR